MCLITEQKQSEIAKEDVVCYKIIQLNPNNGKYESYFYSKKKWKLNQLYSTTLNKSGEYVLEGFHSYAHYQDALEKLEKEMPLGCILVKCVIPKDSIVYKGKHNDTEGYTSNKITMTEIILKKGELIINDDTYPYKRTDELEVQIKAKYNNCLKYTDLIYSIYKYNGQYHIITSLFHIITNEKGELLTNYYKTIQITHISHVEK